MFLNYLQEKNKEKFLKLCVLAALSNEVFEKEEEDIIDAYCREMNIQVHLPEVKETMENLVEDILNNTTSVERNIMILEILALVHSDGVYDEDERRFMETLVKDFGISEEYLSELKKLLDQYTEVGRRLYMAVNE